MLGRDGTRSWQKLLKVRIVFLVGVHVVFSGLQMDAEARSLFSPVDA